MLALQLVLVVEGVAAELLALFWAFREVGERRADLRADRKRLRSVTVSVDTAWMTSDVLQATLESSPPPTLEQRVASLEAEAEGEALQEALSQAQMQARLDAQRQASQMGTSLRTDLGQNVDEVRDLLHQVTEPNARTWRSLRLLVGGLVLQAVAVVLGIVTQWRGS